MDNNNVLIERLFDIPVALMWEVWTKPEFINQWFGSDPDGAVISSDTDLVVGGQYRVTFQDSDGSTHTAFGKFTEVVEPEKLRYTWQWENEAGYVSAVSIAFIPKAGKTLLVFEHVNLNPNSTHEYLVGWNGAMDKIVNKIIEKQYEKTNCSN